MCIHAMPVLVFLADASVAGGLVHSDPPLEDMVCLGASLRGLSPFGTSGADFDGCTIMCT